MLSVADTDSIFVCVFFLVMRMILMLMCFHPLLLFLLLLNPAAIIESSAL